MQEKHPTCFAMALAPLLYFLLCSLSSDILLNTNTTKIMWLSKLQEIFHFQFYNFFLFYLVTVNHKIIHD